MSRGNARQTPAANDNRSADAMGAETGLKILIRSKLQPESTSIIIAEATPEQTIRAALDCDVTALAEPVMLWRRCDLAFALDLDHEGRPPVDPEDIDRYFPEALPRPAAAWATHARGLRALFVTVDGVSALELAAIWALLAPLGHLVGWRMEAKTDSRHPAGLRDGARCGRVRLFAPSANIVVPGNGTRSIASEAEIQKWLEEHGLTYGRHPTERCVWCGTKPASGAPAFVVNEYGCNCFRCARRMSWDQLVGAIVKEDQPSLYEAAYALVHYPHQRHILHDMRPSVPEELLRPAWSAMLREVHRDRLQSTDDEERERWKKLVARAMSDHTDVARGASGAWLDARTFEPRTLNANRTLKEMPWCRSGTMIDKASGAGHLEGFVPLQPLGADEVVGPYVEPPTGAIFVRRPAIGKAPPPIALGERRPDRARVEDAWSSLKRRLPGLNRGYVSGLVSGRFFAHRGIGTPPTAAVTGATGTAKTATQKLVASMIGTRAGLVRLGESKETVRKIGLHLEGGCGLIYIDETGRVRHVYEKIEPVLALNSGVIFDAKFQNERSVPMTAMLSILGSTLPPAILRSPELSRRAVGWRLLERARRWDTIVGEIGIVRAANEELRPLLDVVTADIWWRVHELGPRGDWRKLCLDEYEAVTLSELDQLDIGGEGRAEAVRLLYEHFRTCPDAELYDGAGYKGWLVANPQTPAGAILGELIDFEGDRHQTYGEASDLERLDLAEILGFSKPQLRLRVHPRSATWLVKFVQEGVKKGAERPRAQLPRIEPKAGTVVEPEERDAGGREEFEL